MASTVQTNYTPHGMSVGHQLRYSSMNPSPQHNGLYNQQVAVATPPEISQPLQPLHYWTEPQNPKIESSYNFNSPDIKREILNTPVPASCSNVVQHTTTSDSSNQTTPPNPPFHQPTPLRALNPSFLSSTTSTSQPTSAPESTQGLPPHSSPYVPHSGPGESTNVTATIKRNRDAYECDESTRIAPSELHSRPTWRRRIMPNEPSNQQVDSHSLQFVPAQRNTQLSGQQTTSSDKINPNQISFAPNRMLGYPGFNQGVDPRFTPPGPGWVPLRGLILIPIPIWMPRPTLISVPTPVPVPTCARDHNSAPHPFYLFDPNAPLSRPRIFLPLCPVCGVYGFHGFRTQWIEFPGAVAYPPQWWTWG